MAVRIFDFIVDQIPIHIERDGERIPAKGASMSWKAAQSFVEEGKKMLADKEATEEQWLNRTLDVVAESLKRAGNPLDREELQEQFDIPTLNEMNNMILVKSGLRNAKNGDSAGGAKAASTS